jgi:hypothetical protein
MSNLDNIIADIKDVNRTCDFWIRNEDGNIKDDVICGEVIPFLEELKDYEVDMSQDEIESTIDFWYNNSKLRNTANFWGSNLKAKCWGDNTYNHGANIDHDIDYRVIELESGGVWFALMVHRYGDVRANYTDWAVCKFDYVEEIFGLDSVMQCKYFGEHYVADINIFSETYNVYDTDKCEDVGDFYDIEVAEVLKSIHELEKD